MDTYGKIPYYTFLRMREHSPSFRAVWAYLEALGSMYFSFRLDVDSIRLFHLKAIGSDLKLYKLNSYIRILRKTFKAIRTRELGVDGVILVSTRAAEPNEKVINFSQLLAELDLPAVESLSGDYCRPKQRLQGKLVSKYPGKKLMPSSKDIYPTNPQDFLKWYVSRSEEQVLAERRARRRMELL